MVKNIIWDRTPITEIPDRSVIRKLGKYFREMENKISGTHPAVKWMSALFIGALISKLADVALSTYFVYGFESLAEVNRAFKVQFAIDLILVLIIIVLVGSLIKVSRRI